MPICDECGQEVEEPINHSYYLNDSTIGNIKLLRTTRTTRIVVKKFKETKGDL
jgi:hypothetical protein